MTIRKIVGFTGFIAFWFLAFQGLSQTATYNASGTFTVPAGVTSITIEAWGGGGAGGGVTGNNASGAGGKGGGYVRRENLSVVPYQSYTVTVGSGGTGSTGNGGNGGSSSFVNGGLGINILAAGGNGGGAGTTGGGNGAPNNGTNPGTGNTGNTPPYSYNGGNGAAGVAGTRGGGGGSSAGTGSDGNNASTTNSNGGGAPIGGGAGANGFTGAGNEGNGNSATQVGGGGGGALTDDNSDYAGGSGAAGRVIVTYTLGSPTTYFSKATGDWNAASTWTTSPTHTGADAGPPAAGDAVVIGNGHTVDTNNGSRSCLDLAIIGSGILDINQDGNTVTVSGNFQMDGTSQVTGNGATRTLNVTGNFTVPSTATNARISGQTVTINGTTTVDGSLTLNNGTGLKTFSSAVTINTGGVWNASGNPATSFGGGITMNGTTFNNGTGAAAFSATQSLFGSSSMTFGGSVTPAASTTLTNSNSATVTINNVVLAGNFTQGANTPTLTVTNAAPFSGAGTFDASVNANTVTYTGASPPIRATTYHNLTINGSVAASVGGVTTVNGTMTVNSAVVNNSTLTVTTALSGTNTLLQGTGSTLNIGGTSGITTLDASSNANTVNYTGAAQTLKAISYRTLGLSGSGVKTMTGITTINGDFTIGGSPSVTAAAALTITGNVTLGSGTTFTAGAFTHNITGNWTNNGTTFDNAGSTINLNGAAQSIGGSSSTTFNNLTLGGSNTKTFSVATFSSGDLSILSGVVANLGGFTSHTAFTLTLNGSAQIAGTWGSTSSSASNQNNTYFTAGTTGLLTVAYKTPITYYSRATGNWDAPATWSTIGFAGAAATSFPIAGDIVNIGGGNRTVTVNVNSACASISYVGGAANNTSVSLAPGISLDVAGAINLPTGGWTFLANFFSNTLAVGAGILNAGSIDLSDGGSIGTHALTISTGTVTVNGDVTASANLLATSITISGAGTLNLGGAFPNSSNTTFTAAATSTVNYNGAAQTISDFAYGNLTLSGSDTKTMLAATDINGTLTISTGVTLDAGALSHTVGGNWVNNGSFTHSGSTITFDGGNQNIGGTSSTAFNNLALNGTLTKTFGRASSSAGYFSVGSGAMASLGGFNHTASTLSLGGLGQAAGTWGGTGSGAANIDPTYFAAVAGILTTTIGGPNIYYSRLTGNWSDVNTWSQVGFGGAVATSFPTAGSVVNIGGGFTVTVDVNSDCSSLIYQGNTTSNNSVSLGAGIILTVLGDINLANGGFTLAPFGFGTNTLAVGGGTLSAGSINFIDAGGFGAHTLTIAAGTATVTGNVTGGMGGILTTISITGAGTLNLGGAFLTPASTAFTAAATSTVNYAGATQTIENFTYGNLTTSGSGTKTFADDSDINGTITIGAGTTLVASASHTVGGNWINNGTFTNSGGTITFDTNGAQSIGGSSATTFNNLTLAAGGTKTFSIATTINATIAINSGVIANLGTAPTVHTARTLSLNNQGQIPGTWGGTGSGAANINATFFAATTGIINVTNRIYYSRAAGNWDVTTSWSTVSHTGGVGTNAGTTPGAGDIAVIGENFDITVNVNSQCAFIGFQTAPPANQENLLTVNNGITLNVSGSITIPRAPTGETNTLAVGSGTLNAGSLLFTNGTAGGTHRMTISTGTATISGDVSEVGSTGSATITFTGAGQLNLGGEFLNSNNGTFTPSTGTVTYNGSVAQTIGDFTYYNLTLNNTAGTTGQLQLADNTIVTNTLAMTSGLVDLNGATLTLGASGAASTLNRTASATTNWVYGGTFSRFWPASTPVTSASGNFYGLFPVGTSAASSYRPLEINSTSSPTGTGSFSVTHTSSTSVTDLSPAYNDGGTNIVRKHNAQFVTSTTATGGTYNIGVTMTGLPATGSLSDIRLAKNSTATTVTTVGTHAAATGSVSNPTANRTGVALAIMTGDFRITTTNSTNTPLPIDLLQFVAEREGDNVELNWSTASELNNDFFTVERATDLEKFEEVTTIKGQGTINTKTNYMVFDESPLPGVSYYRLKQTDFDGKFTYSELRKVEVLDFTTGLKIYPNPIVDNKFNFELSGVEPGAEVPLKIVNLQGSPIFEATYKTDQSGRIKASVELAQVSSGMYIVIVNAATGLRKKIVIP